VSRRRSWAARVTEGYPTPTLQLDRSALHPAAARLLTDESEVLCTDDVGPLGSDRGHDAAEEFRNWRAEHPARPAAELLPSIVEGWDVRYRPELSDDADVRAQLAADAAGEVDGYEELLVRDETLIATFLAQILEDGAVDEHARGMVRAALKRQTHPLVVERFFVPDARETRLRAMREASRLVEAAEGWKRPARGAKTPRVGHKRGPGPCPWSVGDVLVYTLPSSRRLLLHLFVKGSRGGACFYVLDWIGDDVPSPEVVRQLDIKPSNNQWKFSLVLPDVEPGESLPQYRARLEQVLRPTGVSMPSHRTFTGCVVYWQELTQYLVDSYTFDQ
jgi:uncharacterized protein YfeS